MNTKHISLTLAFCFLIISSVFSQTKQEETTNQPTIFAYGGEMNRVFIRYVISLTGKTNPKICFLPTAGADNPYEINYWYELCLQLPVKPSVQRLFVVSNPEQPGFEENLLQMDAIIVGGGNTLNMMGIWKAQGIDTILMKAYKKGIILAGGSAGSLCWFKSGLSDSRPKELSVVDCLGFIDASHCPHFTSEPARKPLYEKFILEKKLLPGYAIDDMAGVLFRDGKFVKALTMNAGNKVYFISVKNGRINEEMLETEIIK
jgi:dipeptidase E